MECHPCYQWLLKIVSPYLRAWPDVDVDVRQKFQFGGIGALLAYEIDLLVTPDPVHRPGLVFEPPTRSIARGWCSSRCSTMNRCCSSPGRTT